ncbi:MAG TPA: hypothetical protein VEF04_11565 [Blastocatellia bacterium]|nr:hypothetical protein [Blastocatellia bacterium]
MLKPIPILCVLSLFLVPAVYAQTPAASEAKPVTQEQTPSSQSTQPALPVLRQYRGVKLNMTADEVKAAMGQPVRSNKDQEEYKLSGDDLMTVHYDTQGKVKTIQLYFSDASHAPGWKEVIGDAEIQQNASGSRFARVTVPAENFWVTMFQSQNGTVTTITISR